MPPFLLGESHGDARMGLARIFGLCAALLFASSVSAAVTIDLGPSDWRRWGDGTSHHHTRGLNTKYGQTVRMPPLNGNLSVTRNAVVPYGSIANGLRQFVRVTPASIAASAAAAGLFAAVDWVFDEASGEWRHWEEETADTIEGTYSRINVARPDYPGRWDNSETKFPSPVAACEDLGAFVNVTPTTRILSNNRFDCRDPRGGEFGAGTTVVGPCPEGYSYSSDLRACVATALVPLGPPEWMELEGYLPNAPASVVGEAAGDAMNRQGAPLNGYSDMTIEGPSSVTGSDTTSTSTDPVTGDTVVTNTSTTTNISYGDTTITTTNTTTSTTYQNGQETGTTVTTETPGELPITDGGGLPPAGEWPGFCDWATVVCDWLNWTQEEPPPDVDLPQVIDDDFFTEKTISFGAKSCPPDHEINLAPFLETTVGVSFQPLCDFASLIYYMVMAASYIIAAYISIGVARNG